MNKAEWDAMDAEDKDQLVWDVFPEIEPVSDDWVLSVDDGETGFDFFDTETEANDALVEYEGYPDREKARVIHWRFGHSFTTDRNACALVLDEIMDREDDELVSRFDTNLFRESGACFGGWHDIDTLRVSPDRICYCAVKAVLADD